MRKSILIADDDLRKLEKLSALVSSIVSDCDVFTARSYQSCIRELRQRRPLLLILDMTMPTFDRSEDEHGGKQRPFAGRDVVLELERREMKLPVIVVSQYPEFVDGAERKTLRELRTELAAILGSDLLGALSYQPGSESWSADLRALLRTWERTL